MSDLVSEQELEVIRQSQDPLAEVLKLAGLEASPWEAMNLVLGKVPNLRIFALIPSSSLISAIHACRVNTGASEPPTRVLTPVEFTQVGLAWRVARLVSGFEDIDLFRPCLLYTSPSPRDS